MKHLFSILTTLFLLTSVALSAQRLNVSDHINFPADTDETYGFSETHPEGISSFPNEKFIITDRDYTYSCETCNAYAARAIDDVQYWNVSISPSGVFIDGVTSGKALKCFSYKKVVLIDAVVSGDDGLAMTYSLDGAGLLVVQYGWDCTVTVSLDAPDGQKLILCQPGKSN